MTVRELIDALTTLPPDLHVYAEGDAGYYEIGAVDREPYVEWRGRWVRDIGGDGVLVWEGLKRKDRPAPDAVDPQVPRTGKPSTRD